jgi:hypothetical protein
MEALVGGWQLAALALIAVCCNCVWFGLLSITKKNVIHGQYLKTKNTGIQL